MEDYFTDQRLSELRASGYIEKVQAFAKSVCAPVLLRDGAGAVSQGSLTIVTGGSGFLGLTAGHVADSIAEKANELQTCQVGATPLDPASLIDRSRTFDLASFRFSDETVRASRHLAYTVKSWPLPALDIGDFVLAAGWPGIYREESDAEFDLAFVWFAGRLQSASDNNLGLALDIKTSRTFSDERVPEHADLGGCSGGPVFRLTETAERDGLNVHFALAGIVYEYSAAWELVLAHPLTSLGADGRFDA